MLTGRVVYLDAGFDSNWLKMCFAYIQIGCDVFLCLFIYLYQSLFLYLFSTLLLRFYCL